MPVSLSCATLLPRAFRLSLLLRRRAPAKSLRLRSSEAVLILSQFAGTDVDVKEHPESFVFVSDMPGCKSHDVKVRVENDNVLVVRGERKPDDDIEGETKFLQKQRRPGHFAFKFMLPENANVDHCKAICRDGVLVVTVPKVPPPDPHAPRFLDVPVA